MQWWQWFLWITFGLLALIAAFMRVLGHSVDGRIYVPMAVLVLNVPLLVIGLLKHRGTTVLVATERGLSFRNALQLRPRGHVPRDEIELLAVTPEYGFKRRHRLLLRERSGRTHVLAELPKRDVVEQMRQALLEAMGLARPAVAAQ